MAMPLARPFPDRTRWTVADLDALPDDGNRYEILHGELLVTPPPSSAHQGIAMRLTVLLGLWCRANTGWMVLAPAGVHVSDSNWFEPDVAVYPEPEYTRRPWRELSPPLLVVEIVSASTQVRDREGKRPAYLAHGVKEVWLIDDDARSMERWTLAAEFPELYSDAITWNPDPAAPALMITANELFGAAS
jgi:Uma2 family endonuclease